MVGAPTKCWRSSSIRGIGAFIGMACAKPGLRALSFHLAGVSRRVSATLTEGKTTARINLGWREGDIRLTIVASSWSAFVPQSIEL